MEYLIVCGLMGFGVVLGMLIAYVMMKSRIKQPVIRDYKNHLTKQGFIEEHGTGKGINYNLKSFDSGKNWYVVEYNYDSEELKILGGVDDVYPGLMKKIENDGIS